MLGKTRTQDIRCKNFKKFLIVIPEKSPVNQISVLLVLDLWLEASDPMGGACVSPACFM